MTQCRAHSNCTKSYFCDFVSSYCVPCSVCKADHPECRNRCPGIFSTTPQSIVTAAETTVSQPAETANHFPPSLIFLVFAVVVLAVAITAVVMYMFCRYKQRRNNGEQELRHENIHTQTGSCYLLNESNCGTDLERSNFSGTVSEEMEMSGTEPNAGETTVGSHSDEMSSLLNQRSPVQESMHGRFGKLETSFHTSEESHHTSGHPLGTLPKEHLPSHTSEHIHTIESLQNSVRREFEDGIRQSLNNNSTSSPIKSVHHQNSAENTEVKLGFHPGSLSIKSLVTLDYSDRATDLASTKTSHKNINSHHSLKNRGRDEDLTGYITGHQPSQNSEKVMPMAETSPTRSVGMQPTEALRPEEPLRTPVQVAENLYTDDVCLMEPGSENHPAVIESPVTPLVQVDSTDEETLIKDVVGLSFPHQEVTPFIPGVLNFNPNIHPNRPIYEILRRIAWVQGYYSEGGQIEVFVDYNEISPEFALEELVRITKQKPEKFKVSESSEE